MKYNKGFVPMILIAIIVGALIIGGGVYYLGKNKGEENKNVVENNTQNIDNKVTSNCLPTTAPWIKVVSPNGGEVYQIGQSVVFKWTSCNLTSNVSGELEGISDPNNSKALFGEGEGGSLNSGQQTINFGPIPSTGVQWINPGTYKFKVRKFNNNVVVDSSDGVFTINPNSQESTKSEKQSEKQIGYIKSIYSKDNTDYLTIDYVQWTSCDADDCIASIKVINDNPLIRTFPMSKNVQVKLQTYHEVPFIYYSLNQNISLSKFREALDYSLNHPLNPAHPPEVYYPKTILYWITIENGIITEIAEQFKA